MVISSRRGEEEVRALLASVVDPEIPVLTIEDMGILREVAVEGDAVTVTVTPTYSGCPALDLIRERIVETLRSEGFSVEVRTAYSPAWSTELVSDAGRRKLREIGIAPPGPPPPRGLVLCPHCESSETRIVSEFGSTACKALLVCDVCGEPFDLFKEL